jgi:dUTP pyrophosphatase
MDVRFRRLREGAVIPEIPHAGDAGTDLITLDTVRLEPGERALVGTGLALEIPEGFAGLVLPRSGLASRHGVTCANAPGLIDAGYRGEIRVALVNLDPREPYEVRPGDRVAQLLITPVPAIRFVEAETLGESTRGVGGFGSSGR